MIKGSDVQIVAVRKSAVVKIRLLFVNFFDVCLF